MSKKKAESAPEVKEEAVQETPEVQEEEPAVEQDVNEVEEEEADEETTMSKNVKEEYVDYILPFLPGTQQGESQTVTINGKNYQVQYGVPVKVPLGVKEILEDMVKASYLLKEKVDRMTKEDKCITKLD